MPFVGGCVCFGEMLKDLLKALLS